MNKKILKRRSEGGQGLVEMALVTPLLLFILAGLVHFGFLLESQQVITNASRVGARRGTQPGGDTGAIQTAVTNYCQQAGLDTTQLSTQVTTDSTTNQLTVTVSYQFTSPVGGFFTWLASWMNFNLVVPTTLQATTVMRL